VGRVLYWGFDEINAQQVREDDGAGEVRSYSGSVFFSFLGMRGLLYGVRFLRRRVYRPFRSNASLEPSGKTMGSCPLNEAITSKKKKQGNI
jgi:hypothetical protein